MQDRMDIKAIWNQVMDQVKMKVIHPSLWRTLEMAVPITIENNVFIVGFASGNFHMSGHMTSSEHKNAIEAALKQFTGVPLVLRVIDGVTLQDWVQAKVKDESLQAMREAAYKKRETESAVTKSWDGLLEQVGRRYAALSLRQLPQFRAKYIEEMLLAISDTMDVLMPQDGRTDELAERALARVLDKVGTLVETPSSMIALELVRMRARKKQ